MSMTEQSIYEQENKVKNFEKILLGAPPRIPVNDRHIFIVDGVVKATRRLGVSVECFFQRYGYFSVYDGLRKLDEKQFVEAGLDLFDATSFSS